MKTTIGLVDDHQLFLKSLSLMIETFTDFEVIVEALNGKDLIIKLSQQSAIPEIILVDVNMPGMNGVETALSISKSYPSVKIVALSVNDTDVAIIKMFRAGCCSYLLKDTHPTEFEKALRQISDKGFYNPVTNNFNFGKLLAQADEKKYLSLSIRETEFLSYVCTELTYKQIANNMNLSERTIDGYREALFSKFQVQSRVGLCLEALRKGFVNLKQ